LKKRDRERGIRVSKRDREEYFDPIGRRRYGKR
jgi:hypothetical protein